MELKIIFIITFYYIIIFISLLIIAIHLVASVSDFDQ